MDGLWSMLPQMLDFLNVAMSSVLVILAFSLLAYTLTYNFRDGVARWFALLLACVAVTYASEVALDRVVAAASAARWLRLQWLGIAILPSAYYLFSLSVLRTTNYRTSRRRGIALATVLLSGVSALSALLGDQIVGVVHFRPPISYLEAGPYFGWFALYFVVALALSLANVWKARARCLTEASRQRMTQLLVAFIAPGVGIFPYLIGLGRFTGVDQSGTLILVAALLVNSVVAVMLILMAYAVAYFGVLTPDRVVRYRLIRFFFRGPVVAIAVILALQTVPRVERLLGLPRDVVLFSVITGVIVLSQLILSVTKTLVDRLVYREDRDEIAWLRELDRRLLATSDIRQFLENNLAALCELLRVPSGFVAATAGPDLMLEALVGPAETREQVTAVEDWGEALSDAIKHEGQAHRPLSHGGFWIWPLVEPGTDNPEGRVVGVLGVKARTETPLLSQDELAVLDRMVASVARALMDRQLQQRVFDALKRIIPDIERIQHMRNVVPYQTHESDEPPTRALLSPNPVYSPEFEAWVKDALSHYWGGPKLTRSPLVQLRVVGESIEQADSNPTKALRLVLGKAIERLRPDGRQDLSAPEWLLYNILEMRFIQGRKVRDIADRLAISESDLYRKQRVAIGQVARVLTEMEQANGDLIDTFEPTAADPKQPLVPAREKEETPAGSA
jgi:GAF domain-containing protein